MGEPTDFDDVPQNFNDAARRPGDVGERLAEFCGSPGWQDATERFLKEVRRGIAVLNAACDQAEAQMKEWTGAPPHA